MKAMKCDVCGGYFDFGKKDDTNTIVLGHIYPNGNTDYSVYKDLCPACMAAIKKAIDNRRKCGVDPMEDDLK